MSLKATIDGIPPAVKLIGGTAIALTLLLTIWFYGTRITNAISRKIFSGKNTVISADIQKSLDTAKAAQEVANLAIQELADKKVELAKAESDLANANQKLQAAETILADKTKTTDAKIKAYQESLNSAPVVRVVPESVDEQCARAKARGLELSVCQ